MRFLRYLSLILISIAVSGVSCKLSAREVSSFDNGWRFMQDDELEGAEVVGYDDSDWLPLSVPHDWSIAGEVDRDNPTGRGGAYMPCGIGWYRKSFEVAESEKGSKVYIDFDGIMANSDVWLNGKLLGHRPYGYVSFRYDLTDELVYGGENIITVRTDTYDQPASRWYTGAGIYRHVRLVKTAPVHFDHWGVYITTPEVRSEKARVKIANAIVNDSSVESDIKVRTEIVPTDKLDILPIVLEVSGKVEAGGKATLEQNGIIDNPQIWDIDSPKLYRALSKIYIDGKLIDTVDNKFGLRSFEFVAESGFWLNGKNVKIKGVCLHHDGGAVGAAVPKQVWQRRLEQLKKVGCNAIRTAHNPVAPEFLGLCDEMGFVVMSEILDTWRARKNHADYGYQHFFDDWWYADNRDTIMRDRNHPSIIMYSTGNEIRDNLESELGFETLKKIYDVFKEYDPTRPVTQGLFRPNQSRLYDSGYADMLDVVGQNYREGELVAAYKARPTRKVIGTENGHSREAWLVLRDNPFMAGQFLWTGIDYLGEADWPDINWSNACIDRIGTIRPMGYQRMSWWSEQPMVYIARKETASGGAGSNINGGETVSHWTPRDYDTYDVATVEVYSNCEKVELFLNEKSLGEKAMPSDASSISWTFPYAKGTLKAIGKNSQQQVAEYIIKSSEYPVDINIEADKKVITNNFDDVSHVTFSFIDENDVECPWAEKVIKFEVSGPGKIIAVDNGDPTFHDSFQAGKCRTWHGKCIAIIAATADEGEIIIKATSRGMKSKAVVLKAAPKE